MTSRERLLTTLRGGQPDRVPVTIYEHSPYHDAWANQEPSYAPLLQLERDFGDSFTFAPFNDWIIERDPQRVRVTDLAQTDGSVVRTREVHTPRGLLRTAARRDPGAETYWQIEPLIKSDEDLERVLSLPAGPYQVDVARLGKLEAAIGAGGILCFSMGDAFGQVATLFDYQDFAKRCHRDDGPIRALIDNAQEFVLTAIRALGDVVDDACFRLWGAEYCGAPLMNPARHFRRYVVEPDIEATDAIHATGNFSVIHCHGRLRDLLDPIAEIGADALEPLETLPMKTADVTLAEIKARVGDRMCLMGAVQALTLETAEPDEIRRAVRQAIEAGATGGRFVLLPTSAPFMIPLAPRCLANVEAMYRAAHEYGRYDEP